jgi:hypothetical protein
VQLLYRRIGPAQHEHVGVPVGESEHFVINALFFIEQLNATSLCECEWSFDASRGTDYASDPKWRHEQSGYLTPG